MILSGSKRPQRLRIAFVLLSAAWGVFALLVVPHIIRAAHAGRSLPFFNAVIEGGRSHPVEQYLAAWRRVALQLTLGGGLAAALALVAWRRQQRDKSTLSRAVPAVFVGGSLALASGILEAWYRAVGEPALPAFGYEFLWIAPAGMLLLSAPLILAVAFARAVRPGWVTLPRAVLVLSIMPVLTLSLMLLRQRMPDGVHLIVALAAAAALKRFAAGHESLIERTSRRAFPVLLAVPLLTLGAVKWARPRGERAAIRQLPPAPAGAPNVLLIVWDAVREGELSLYGYRLSTTPHLEQRAAAGVMFDRAYSTAPWTLPSHASLFTGRLTQEFGVLDWITPLGRSFPTLAEVLAEHGFRAGGFTANLMATVRPTGLARGFHHYEDWPVTLHPRDIWSHLTLVQRLRHYPPFTHVLSFQLYWKDAPQVTDSFLDWLDGPIGHERPFFAFLNYFNAHQPYRAPDTYRRRFPGDTAQSRYDAAIAYQDAELERLFGALGARNLLDRTIVVLVADHGEAFGEHGRWGHGGDLHIEQLRVPFLLWAPGRVPAGLRVSASVSLSDVPNTLLDLALSRPPLQRLGGRSLARFWRGGVTAWDTIVSGFSIPVRDTGAAAATSDGSSLILDHFHYFVTDSEFLFDLSADPEERHNLTRVDSLQRLLAGSREYLRTHFGPAWTRFLPSGGAPRSTAPP